MKPWIKRSLIGLTSITVLLGGLTACGHRDHGRAWSDERVAEMRVKVVDRVSGKLDLNAILFLIGVQELGQHARDFKKDEKVALMHIAICVVLLPFGYYKELGRDADGWPHFERVKDLPALGAEEQERLMKEAVLAYFDAY